jgi:excisionase family DNA binding protein
MNIELETVLLQSGALTSQTLARNVGLAHARNVSLWELLVLERQVSEETLANAFSTCLNVPRLRLDAIVVEAYVLKLVSVRLARKHTCMPVRLYGKALVLAMANPLDRQAIEDVEGTASRHVRAVVACRSEILQSIDRHYREEPYRPAECSGATAREFATSGQAHGHGRLSADSPVADELCARIIHDAIAARASDIHVEPGAVEMSVRLRVDGVLRDHLRLPGWMHAGLLSRVKVLAKLGIAQQRLPQHGRIQIHMHGRRIDLDVSTSPTHLGEKAVLRVLGAAKIPSIDEPRSAGTTPPGHAASSAAAAFDTTPAWLSVAQLCQRWQLDRKTVYKFIDSGILPAWKVGPRLYRVAVEDLLIFEAQNRLLTK